MGLVILFAAWVDAQVPQLGHDRWEAREAAQARLDSFLPALFLPFRSDDPEIDYRVKALRARNLKWFDPAYHERALHCRDFRRWLALCVLEGDSVAFKLDEVFLELHGSHAKARLFMELTTARGATCRTGSRAGSFRGSSTSSWPTARPTAAAAPRCPGSCRDEV